MKILASDQLNFLEYIDREHSLPEILRMSRKEHDMTMENFGKKLGVTKATINNWEKENKVIRVKTLKRMYIENPEKFEKYFFASQIHYLATIFYQEKKVVLINELEEIQYSIEKIDQLLEEEV